ncbi:Pyridoxamine 5'-phosphate oxidase [Cyphellophora attinorum]|uniref:pyridoxal 5'-phosphate synthase n=1 Tax=Cyphellophora attinorum TaxID=1664694 RepID=A0A0N0NL09_9EURO|nr:Pyridoxamine 5'-phosphate oxidase [Phialophora attinorum]KPI38638.1 Pyridoxamine 5'-phosphate oxidase [Phialophora attinorum]
MLHTPTHTNGNPPDQPSTSQTQNGRPIQHCTLHRKDLSPSPFTQFHTWFTHPALVSTVPETCTLSTASLPSGRVSARMVYLKELDSSGGFVIYSNFGTSRKARDLETNKYASLVFWWKALERQVRVEGKAERLSEVESQVYYDTRARGSRLGAWASRQSEVLEPTSSANGNGGESSDDGRAKLDGWVKDVEKRFDGQDKIPVPDFWGGLRVVPEVIEFWQGRDSRLHDRFQYTKQDDGGWKIERLSP